MTMEEAQEILQEIKHYLTAGNPVWDVDEIAEACDMAIEALQDIEDGKYIELDEELENMLMV